MKKSRSMIPFLCVSVILATMWAKADSQPQLSELSHQTVCTVIGTGVSLLWKNSHSIFPHSAYYATFHLWIRVSANDKANRSWGAFAQDGVDFA